MFDKMLEMMMKSLPDTVLKHFQENIEGISKKVADFDLRLKRVEALTVASFDMELAICRKLDIDLPVSATRVKLAMDAQKLATIVEQEPQANAA